MNEPACRIDVWLWRARFFKTRGLAARFVEDGRVRRTRPGRGEVRLDKASRTARAGDRLVFILGDRVVELTIQELRGGGFTVSTPEVHPTWVDRDRGWVIRPVGS